MWQSLSRLVSHLLVTQGAYSRRRHLKCAPIGLALALPSNSNTWLERVSKDKRSSLSGLVVSDEGKKFYNIDTWLTDSGLYLIWPIDKIFLCSFSQKSFGRKTFGQQTFDLRDNLLTDIHLANRLLTNRHLANIYLTNIYLVDRLLTVMNLTNRQNFLVFI